MSRARKRSFILCVLVSLATGPFTFSQENRLTLERIFGSEKLDFDGAPQSGFEWIDDARFLWPKTDAKGDLLAVVEVDVKTGEERTLIEPEEVERALVAEGVDAEEARSIARESAADEWVPDHSATFFEAGDDLFLWDAGTRKLERLTRAEGEEEVATFSPDGERVAFVRSNDLFVVDRKTRRERDLTRGGSETLLNGKLDWVYQEELYGRGNFRGYWWSPDSRKIAFIQTDESPVGEFLVVDDIPYRQSVERTRYPKAGDPNPIARLFVVDVADGVAREMDLNGYPPEDRLIVDVAWSTDNRVVFQIQNREQTWLDLNLADPENGTREKVFRESTPAWVEMAGSPFWLSDGTFLWLSERDGWKHLYHYRGDGSLIRQVTRGEWEVATILGVDERNRTVFFEATERSSRDTDVYRIRLDGRRMIRLSEEPGRHAATFNPSLTMYVDRFGNLTTPVSASLHDSDGRRIRVVHANDIPLLESLGLSEPEFLQVKARDGFAMEAILIRPPDFDPSKKYPVYQHIYGGPHAPQVRNVPAGERYYFHQFLAQQGIVVWIVDNRTASGKGAVSTWPVHRSFGELELRDIEDALAWLEGQPWIDGDRIMISGWSFGGFMVSYALTHSASFAGGIAGGSVTDWRDYDTVYTERYMGTPQNNEEGYRKSSPRFFANDLQGRILLLHGTGDDNVHVQNTLQFALELQKAGKPFQMMLYPTSRHGITHAEQKRHQYETMWSFIAETLLSVDDSNK